ncbi:MAG: glycosyltransferase family 2 protein [Bacteroidia bacterium]|nr:glycosyltransferase family 2 protein [Bacteroidia bacterium]
MPDVSVLLPLRNEAHFLDRILTAINAQVYTSGSIEFLLIDGASTDGSRISLETTIELHNQSLSFGTGRTLRVLENPATFVSHALNVGLTSATGDIIVRWDAHTEYDVHYITRCVGALEHTGAWNVGGPARTKATGYVQRAIAAAYHSPFSVGGARFHDVDYEGYVDTVTYGCWRRQTLQDLGGFDEELVRNQDDELNLRIIRAGGTIYQSPEIVSWYYPRSRLRDLFRQYLQYGYWKVRVIRKHKLPASPRHLVPVLFVLGLFGGPLLAALWSPLLWVYGGAVSLYTAANLFFSFKAAREHGMDLLPALPATFACYHISYGLGFLMALLHALLGITQPGRLFTGLSR